MQQRQTFDTALAGAIAGFLGGVLVTVALIGDAAGAFDGRGVALVGGAVLCVAVITLTYDALLRLFNRRRPDVDPNEELYIRFDPDVPPAPGKHWPRPGCVRSMQTGRCLALIGSNPRCCFYGSETRKCLLPKERGARPYELMRPIR